MIGGDMDYIVNCGTCGGNHKSKDGFERQHAAPVVQGVVMTQVEIMDQMPWSCCDCKQKFMGPKNRMPLGGCPVCGSSQVFDCNVEPVIIEYGPQGNMIGLEV